MTGTVHLDIGGASSEYFLRTWHHWRAQGDTLADSARGRMLHFVLICAAPPVNQTVDADLKSLSEELDAQLWGLLPGFHRLVFEGGQVLLTLCIGDAPKLLRQQQFEADFVTVSHAAFDSTNLLYLAKAIARLCKPGTQLQTTADVRVQAALRQCGFVPTVNGHDMTAVFQPTWHIKNRSSSVAPSTCVVVGAGLAGAAVANSLARRGWAVTVMDAADAPANGTSGLPAGLLVAHTSVDDSALSRLSRAGVRITLEQTRRLLRHGVDWGHTGVLQRQLDVDATTSPPNCDTPKSSAAIEWCSPASNRTLAAAGLAQESRALWHVNAGWIKPTTLVSAWLASPGIRWQGGVHVAKLVCITGKDTRGEKSGLESRQGGRQQIWQVHDVSGKLLAQADLVVVCAGYDSRALARASGASVPHLQALRGQVTFGLQKDADTLPPFAVNGNGSLISAVTTPSGPIWLVGASYERDATVPDLQASDHAENLNRLQTLLPHAAPALADQFDPARACGWAGIRCATPNRLPLLEQLVTTDLGPGNNAGLWICTGMGSRGLTFAALCGEVLAAQLHAEPLPIERQLASALQQRSRLT